MKRSTGILAAVLFTALLAACSKQSLQNTYDRQTTFIESFVAAQMKADTNATLRRIGGAYRLTLHDTLTIPRDSLAEGGKLALYYGCFTLTGASLTTGNLVATNLKDLATQAKWTLTDSTRYKLDTLTLGKDLVEGLQDGLKGVREYDEGYILFTGKYGYGNSERGTIPARSALAYYFWIESIDNE